MAHSRYLPAFLIFACVFVPARAQQANTPEARAREALRNAVIQLRSVTTERDTLQTQNADLQTQVQDLAAQVARLTRQGAADRDFAAKTIGALQARAGTQAKSIDDYQKALESSQAEARRIAALLATCQTRAATLAGDNVTLKQCVEGEKARNAGMMKIAMEVLARYRRQGIGDLLLGKEPFTGIARARLENLAQDYGTRLLAERPGREAR